MELVVVKKNVLAKLLRKTKEHVLRHSPYLRSGEKAILSNVLDEYLIKGLAEELKNTLI